MDWSLIHSLWLPVCLKWLVVLAAWAFLSAGLYRDHRHVSRLDSQHTDYAALFRRMHLRHLQLWGVLTFVMVICAVSDVRPLLAIQPIIHAKAAALPDMPVTILPKPAAPQTIPALPASSSLPFTEITEFNEANSRQQAYLDWLKEQYEDWLVTYYYLNKCGKVGSSDLTAITAALARELSAARAQAVVADHIMTAARGSYDELYADIPCDASRLATTRAAYDATMARIRAKPTSAAGATSAR